MIELHCEYLSGRCIWLYVLIMSRTCFRVSPHFIVALNVKELLVRNRHEIWSLSNCNWTRTHNHLVHKRTLNHLAKLVKWLSCVVSTYLEGASDRMFFIISSTRFRVSPHSIVGWISRKSLHETGKYSQHSSNICSVWLNGWVFVYELSGCGFESSYSHLNFTFRSCFEKGVPWNSGNYRVWTHSGTHTWHDKNTQSNTPYR